MQRPTGPRHTDLDRSASQPDAPSERELPIGHKNLAGAPTDQCGRHTFGTVTKPSKTAPARPDKAKPHKPLRRWRHPWEISRCGICSARLGRANRKGRIPRAREFGERWPARRSNWANAVGMASEWRFWPALKTARMVSIPLTQGKRPCHRTPRRATSTPNVYISVPSVTDARSGFFPTWRLCVLEVGAYRPLNVATNAGLSRGASLSRRYLRRVEDH